MKTLSVTSKAHNNQSKLKRQTQPHNSHKPLKLTNQGNRKIYNTPKNIKKPNLKRIHTQDPISSTITKFITKSVKKTHLGFSEFEALARDEAGEIMLHVFENQVKTTRHS